MARLLGWRTKSHDDLRVFRRKRGRVVLVFDKDPKPESPAVRPYKRSIAIVVLGLLSGGSFGYLITLENREITLDRAMTYLVTPFKRLNPTQPWEFYLNCSHARAAGVAPIRRGDPGYSARLDADSDGVACEPYSVESRR